MQGKINNIIQDDLLSLDVEKENPFMNKEDELDSIDQEIKSSKSEDICNVINCVFSTCIDTNEVKDDNSEDSEFNNRLYLLKKKTKKKYFLFERYKPRGRSSKNQHKIGKHDTFSKDNMIIKIKTYFLNNFLLDVVNQNVTNKSYFLKKFPNFFIRKIEGQTNLQLLDSIYADVLKRENISSKYSKSTKNENKNIVNRILEENNQPKVIKILNLKVGELFEIFRRKLYDNEENISYDLREKIKDLDLLDNNNKYKGFECFINKIKEKKKMRKTKFIEYKKKLEDLCIKYEDWFQNRAKKFK